MDAQHSSIGVILHLLILFMTDVTYSHPASMKSFTIDYANNQFLKDEKPFRYISGEMHYFRVPSQYWEDRLYKLRKGGMNAVQTYIAWNVHEPFKGRYQFSGDYDILKFIKLAQKNDLLVILRPGPYICAEWEYGGFPYWIMKEMPQSQLRTKSHVYLKIVDKWMSVLLPKIRQLLYCNGGPIISLQVENEYGDYGSDHEYMRSLETIFRKYLVDDVILFTTDGATDWFLNRGTISSLYTTIDFGASGDPKNLFKLQRKYQPHGPLVNSEYYTGWLDHWGKNHSSVSGKIVAKTLDDILALNASVNLYMFIGGTNFGFMNGADNGKHGKHFQPTTTSYDYNAPLTESGDLTEKYYLIQKVISKYTPLPPGPPPVPTKKGVYGVKKASRTISFYAFLAYLKPVENQKPLSFEAMDIPYGYVLYRTSIKHMYNGKAVLDMKKVHDRAVILVDGQKQGIVCSHNSTISINEGSTLDILVENQGRIYYGTQMKDTAKGILGDVIINDQAILDWKMYAVNKSVLLNAFQRENSSQSSQGLEQGISAPCVTYFTFSVRSNLDTYLKLEWWTKGFVLVNGFNVGRYWTPAGPQRTLYIPKHLLKMNNTLVLFETDALPRSPTKRVVEFVGKPIWTN